jgi:hypothetical protein
VVAGEERKGLGVEPVARRCGRLEHEIEASRERRGGRLMVLGEDPAHPLVHVGGKAVDGPRGCGMRAQPHVVDAPALGIAHRSIGLDDGTRLAALTTHVGVLAENPEESLEAARTISGWAAGSTWSRR